MSASEQEEDLPKPQGQIMSNLEREQGRYTTEMTQWPGITEGDFLDQQVLAQEHCSMDGTQEAARFPSFQQKCYWQVIFNLTAGFQKP